LKSPVTVPITQLDKEPYASILCYPRASPLEIEGRIEELRQHGVKAVEFSGKAAAFNVSVLGKGYVGIVVTAHLNGQKVALKMRRVDADRQSLEHEAKLLTKANSVNVGPKFIAVSNDFLLMQLIDGDVLADWLETHRDKEVMRRVLVDILEQCWRLDEAGLDHGELSKAPKHLLVDNAGKPFIVDFETASVERRVANVTAASQFLFAGNSTVAATVAETFGERNRLELIDALKAYKKNRTRRNFEGVLEVCLS
jgi:putative serine/threonine protein kinase